MRELQAVQEQARQVVGVQPVEAIKRGKLAVQWEKRVSMRTVLQRDTDLYVGAYVVLRK